MHVCWYQHVRWVVFNSHQWRTHRSYSSQGTCLKGCKSLYTWEDAGHIPPTLVSKGALWKIWLIKLQSGSCQRLWCNIISRALFVKMQLYLEILERLLYHLAPPPFNRQGDTGPIHPQVPYFYKTNSSVSFPSMFAKCWIASIHFVLQAGWWSSV